MGLFDEELAAEFSVLAQLREQDAASAAGWRRALVGSQDGGPSSMPQPPPSPPRADADSEALLVQKEAEVVKLRDLNAFLESRTEALEAELDEARAARQRSSKAADDEPADLPGMAASWKPSPAAAANDEPADLPGMSWKPPATALDRSLRDKLETAVSDQMEVIQKLTEEKKHVLVK